MGYRTVVVLNNDQEDEWSKDKALGKKISHGLSWSRKTDLGYGTVVECSHADAQTLMMFDGFDGNTLAYHIYNPKSTTEEMQIALLKGAAVRLGYKLVKIKPKKSKEDKNEE